MVYITGIDDPIYSGRRDGKRSAAPYAERVGESRPYARRYNPYGAFLDEDPADSLKRRNHGKPKYLDDSGSNAGSDDLYGGYAWSRQVYPRFAVPGWGHLLLGMACIVVGSVDIGWTAAKYEGSCDFTETADFDPCGSNNVFSYIASPIWGGLLMLFNGLVTLWMSPLRLNKRSWMLYIFVGLSTLLVLPVDPAILVLNILELTENSGTFWADISGELQVASGSTVKFALPIVLIVLAFLDWLLAIASVFIGCCFPPDLTQRLMYPGVDKYLASIPRPQQGRHPRRGDVVVSEEVIRPGGRSYGAYTGYGQSGDRASRGYAAQTTFGQVERPRSDYYDHYRPRSRNGDRVISEERIRPRSDRGYAAFSGYNVPPLGRSYGSSEGDRRSRGGSRGGDRVVYEERIRPGDAGYPRSLY